MLMSRLLPSALVSAFILWLAFVLSAFYVVQRPVTAEDASALREALQAWSSPLSAGALLDAVLNLLTVTLFTSAALIMGVLISPNVPETNNANAANQLEYWLLSTGMGYGTLGILIFGMALAGWIQPIIFTLVGIGIFLIGGKRAISRLRDYTAAWRGPRLPLPLLIVAIMSVSISLLMALAPPTAWDGLVYHLTIPQRAIAEGRLTPQHNIIPHEDFPLLMSSLFLAAMAVRGEIAAQGIHWVYGVLCIGLVALCAYHRYGRMPMAYAVALALSVPMLLLLSSWAYNDAALAFYIVAATYAIDRWRTTGKSYYLTLAGCMAGFAMGLKYTSFVLPVGIAALLGWELRRKSIRPIVRFALVSALVASPWYVKNFFFTGNPVYPFVFGGTDWDAMRAAWYARPGTGIGFDFVTLLTLPITVTLGFRDANYFDGRTGPLLLASLPLLIPLRIRPDRYLIIGALFAAFWVSGVIGTWSLWQSRLLLPALLLIIPAQAGALDDLRRFDHPRFSLQRLMNLVIGLVLVVTLLTQMLGLIELNPFAYIVGAENRQHFLLRQMGTHAEAMQAVASLPPGARVQFMWEPRSYLAGRSVRADPLLDALPHLLAVNGSLEAGVRRLRADGFTHVLVYEAGAAFAFENLPDTYTEQDKQTLAVFEQQYARLMFDNKAYHLLELK